ncbi:lipopolysaccharide biosynthesis protein [Anaerocolumna aminovalerica]|uniref:lipopolysaccharide biosynthesis protein n=1 Tax=Anaerocolumna aminovalerica TaxID=1527 RepID=UPI00248CD11B|nr:oligosaccharide flippase family protein [Anaerocolumna aminovalerica]
MRIAKTTNQLKAGAIISYLQMGIQIIIGLAYTPIMIRLLGQSEYGLYNTVASTISMLSVLRLGFNNSYIRYYSIYKKNSDNKAIGRLNGLFLAIFSCIGLIALICGLFLTNHLTIVFSTGLTSEEYGIAKVLMALLTLNLAISFPMSVFSNIISAHERFVFLKCLEVLKNILGPMVTLPLLLMGFRSIAMVAVTFIVSLFVDICYVVYVLHVLKNRFVFKVPETALFKDLFAYTAFIAIELIVDQINWNIDKILLARYKGTAMVAVYSVGYSLYTYYQTFSSSISGVFTPRIHRIVNTIDDKKIQKKELTDLFTRVGRVQFLIMALIATGVAFFGKFFIRIWAGNEYGDSYFVALLLIFPSSIALIQNLGIEIQRAEFKHQFRSIVYIFMAFVNFILSIILCQKYGAVGSAIGTAISLIVANGIIMNIYYHLKCNIDIISFWKSILKLAVGLIIPIIVGCIINMFFKTDAIIIYIAEIFIYVIVYMISMWILGMNRYEKQLFQQFLAKIKKS